MAAGNFRDIIDKPDWRIVSPMVNNTGAGTSICFDETNTSDRFLGVFQFVSNTILNQYNPANDGSTFVGSPGLAGTFGAGANSVFMPSAGPRGTIAAGATTTTITPSATLGATIPQNRLASRGIVGTGFRIRIIDNGAGGTGKTEERVIVGNTSSTTPLIKLNTPLSFTPVSGSSFELLSGRVFLISAGAATAGMFKYYDLATNTFSGNLSVTNLPTIGTDSQMIVLDELYNPLNRNAYEGFVGKITASASGANTITATLVPDVCSAGGVETNQFRNFQVRIIEDTVNTTAVGQRFIIASHTSGTTPVFTMYTNWTVTPSSSAKFVIEYPNEILFHINTTSIYTYAPFEVKNNATPQAANTWSATRYTTRSVAPGVGTMTFAPFGFSLGDTSLDPLLLHRPSKIISFRGNNSTSMDILDIAGGANGAWTNAAPYNSIGTAFTTGSCIAYDPVGEDGKFAYISVNGGQYFVRYNVFTNDVSEWAFLRQTQGTVVVGTRMYTTHAYNSEGGVVPILGHVLCSSNIQHECFITT